MSDGMDPKQYRDMDGSRSPRNEVGILPEGEGRESLDAFQSRMHDLCGLEAR